ANPLPTALAAATGVTIKVCAFARHPRHPKSSGLPVTFYFCPRCGSNLYWEPARLPHLIGMAVGGFSDPRFPLPDQARWTKDMHCWLVLPDGIKPVDTNPTPHPT